MKINPKTKKLLLSLLEKYEQKMDKAPNERFVDAQHAASVLGIKPEEFHKMMDFFKKKNLLAWKLGSGRKSDKGLEYNRNDQSYWVNFTERGIEVALQLRESLEDGTRLIVPIWQVMSGVFVAALSLFLSQLLWSHFDQTPRHLIDSIDKVSSEIRELRLAIPKPVEATTKPTTSPSTTQEIEE